ncbi:cobalt-zinc-cadmium efflux system outer membrane protein [Nitrosospira multiformis]|uniref:Cobalt-zinc-cadmium efflux system outer membrane protein n=2 Tax=Nitrosospira multiformis TaxID=1231 RepID=A0A2T5I774_9PROT|nr:cobalt-zinc-cadmium efflux system outer membrane protein [Nitrosospira multiformis]
MPSGVQVDRERIDVLNLLSNVLPAVRIVLGIMLFLCISAMLHAAPFPIQAESAKEGFSITEQQAIALFYQRNLSLIAARLNINIAEAEQIIAAAIPNPVFSFAVSELAPKAFARESRGLAVPAFIPMIEQLIVTAGKRRLRIESSELATEAVNFDVQDVLRTLTNEVRRSFYTLLLAQKTIAVVKDNLEHYREILRVNDIRLRVGDVAAMDFIRIEVENLKVQGDLDQAQAALNQARADLLLLLAWPENSIEISAVEAWPKAAPEITMIPRDELIQRALDRRPDIRAARTRIAQARKVLTLAQREVIPDVTIGAWYDQDQGNQFARTGGFSVRMPIPLFYQQKGEISRARVGVSSSELALTQAEQGVRAEVMKAFSSWQSTDAIAKRFETSVVQRIETLRKSQELAYQKGAVGVLNLIDAERSYKAIMLDYYTALANRSKAWADLLMAYGEEIGNPRYQSGSNQDDWGSARSQQVNFGK